MNEFFEFFESDQEWMTLEDYCLERDLLLDQTRMAVPEPVSLCIHVTYAETQTDNLGVSLDAVS